MRGGIPYTPEERRAAVALGRRIALLRRNRGLSQRALAREIGVSQTVLCCAEHGLSVTPQRRIADYLGIRTPAE